MGGSGWWMAPAGLGEDCHLLGTRIPSSLPCQLHTIEFLGTAPAFLLTRHSTARREGWGYSTQTLPCGKR